MTLHLKHRIISADSHINEPPDLWTSRLPSAYQERAPHVIVTRSGADAWVVEDTERPMPLGLNSVHYRSQVGRYDRSNYRAKYAEIRVKGVTYDDILTGSYDPKARLDELDEDKVDAEILYNGAGIWPAIKNIGDRELNLRCFQAYNDWIAEFESVDRDRLIGCGAIPVTGIDDAIAELRRCVEDLGLRTVTLESFPSGRYDGPSPDDDRFWAAAVEYDIPVNMHATFSFPTGGVDRSEFLHAAPTRQGNQAATAASTVDGSFAAVFAGMALDGVFDRFPTLQFVGAETNCGWIPAFLDRLDSHYLRYHRRLGGRDLALLPSEYYRRNVHITFIIDQVGVNNRHLMGVETLMWSSDFPHSGSHWPIDRELGYDMCARAGCTPAEAERILWRTAADLYKLDVTT